jgi:membrane protease YdiL (CAAX protease family)
LVGFAAVLLGFVGLMGFVLPQLPAMRRVASGDREAFGPFWALHLVPMWLTASVVMACLVAAGMPLGRVGLAAPPSWTLPFVLAAPALATLAIVLAARRAPAAPPRGAMGALLPHTLPERLFAVFGISVTGAITEEIVYRGFVLAMLTPLCGVWLAVAIQAALFALHHGGVSQGLVLWTVRALLGALLGGVAVATDALLVPMLLHFSIDVLSYGVSPHRAR